MTEGKNPTEVGALLRLTEPRTNDSNPTETISKKKTTYTEADRKAKREWARRNASHKKAYAAEWYEKNKETLSVKRKAQRDALKAQY